MENQVSATPQPFARLFEKPIEKRIRRIAGRYANTEMDAEDIYQAIMAGLIEQAIRRPDFLSQNVSYIGQAAGFIAQHALEKAKTYCKYVRYVAGRPQIENVIHIDRFSSPTISPEKAAEVASDCFNLIDTVRGMNKRDRAIVLFLYNGYTKTEIAKELGISGSAVSQRISAIRAAMVERLA